MERTTPGRALRTCSAQLDTEGAGRWNAPLPDAHRVRIQLLVQIVEEPYRLHNHRVHLVRRELELVPRQAVAQTERHLRQGLPLQTRDEALELRPDAAGELDDFVA